MILALALANAGCGGCDNNGNAPDAAPIVPDALVCLELDEACVDSAHCCSETCLDNVCVMPGNCTAAGEACAATSECCLGSQCLDDGAGGMVCTPGLCAAEGETCSIDSECCSLNCPLGGTTCGPDTGACAITGGDCVDDDDCCSFNCNGTTCEGSAQNCDPIGEACTAGSNSCCTDFCADSSGQICDGADADCRCRLVTGCRPTGELCDADTDCCNGYCDRPGGATVGSCAALGSCETVGEPCGNPGVNGSCCSNACVDEGAGVATCVFLGGCLPLGEVCEVGTECCGGVCMDSGTTADGRPIMRCADTTSCLNPGEVCMTGASSNCCPAGGGSTGCETANSGVDRCFGGAPGCTIPSNGCTTVAECCTDLGAIVCEPGPDGMNICCLPDGESCTFGDTCCSGVCAPDDTGALVCNPGGCVDTGGGCTADSDCCAGCCADDGAGNLTCTLDCMGECTLGQLGEFCSTTTPCCPGLNCTGSSEFKFCSL